mmetsp:Transcript_22779/g.77028  ORF Transcript_22779/g.77028 Transcript_22779/m.77028 type:complete len:232 (+) Transcript_22779:271-966(+)
MAGHRHVQRRPSPKEPAGGPRGARRPVQARAHRAPLRRGRRGPVGLPTRPRLHSLPLRRRPGRLRRGQRGKRREAARRTRPLAQGAPDARRRQDVRARRPRRRSRPRQGLHHGLHRPGRAARRVFQDLPRAPGHDPSHEKGPRRWCADPGPGPAAAADVRVERAVRAAFYDRYGYYRLLLARAAARLLLGAQADGEEVAVPARGGRGLRLGGGARPGGRVVQAGADPHLGV